MKDWKAAAKKYRQEEKGDLEMRYVDATIQLEEALSDSAMSFAKVMLKVSNSTIILKTNYIQGIESGRFVFMGDGFVRIDNRLPFLFFFSRKGHRQTQISAREAVDAFCNHGQRQPEDMRAWLIYELDKIADAAPEPLAK